MSVRNAMTSQAMTKTNQATVEVTMTFTMTVTNINQATKEVMMTVPLSPLLLLLLHPLLFLRPILHCISIDCIINPKKLAQSNPLDGVGVGRVVTRRFGGGWPLGLIGTWNATAFDSIRDVRVAVDLECLVPNDCELAAGEDVHSTQQEVETSITTKVAQADVGTDKPRLALDDPRRGVAVDHGSRHVVKRGEPRDFPGSGEDWRWNHGGITEDDGWWSGCRVGRIAVADQTRS